MSSRRQFTPQEMELVFEMCDKKCFYCHKNLVYANFELGDRGAWHCDHLIPFAKGGMTNSAGSGPEFFGFGFAFSEKFGFGFNRVWHNLNCSGSGLEVRVYRVCWVSNVAHFW